MKRRRANGEGTVRQRANGLWECRVTVAGQRRSVYGKTQREALERRSEALRAAARAVPRGRERQTVQAFLAGWLEGTRSRLRPRTWVRYEQLVRVHIVPSIGTLALAALSPQDVERLYAQRLRAGAAPFTVRHVHEVLHRALEQATTWGEIGRNPASLVQRPVAPRREMATFDESQARSLLAAIAEDRLEALYVVAITTGMRQGELLALRWSDVDLERTTAAVRRSLQRTPEGPVFTPPKSARSRRQVLLTPTAIAALRRHRIRQAEDRLAAGSAWDDQELVFANTVGRPLDGPTVTKAFQAALVRANLPRIRFHDLRHTAATLLLGRGIHPKIVSEQLGHSQIAITLDLYSHVTPTMQRDAAAAIESMLGGAR